MWVYLVCMGINEDNGHKVIAVYANETRAIAHAQRMSGYVYPMPVLDR